MAALPTRPVLVRRELIAAGFLDADLRTARRRGTVVPLHRGVDLAPLTARSALGRALAATAAVPGGAPSGPTAGRLHGWDLPAEWTDEITVDPADPRPRHRPGLRVVARSLATGTTLRHGLRITDAARTAAEIARRQDEVHGLWVVEQALRTVSKDDVLRSLPTRGPGSNDRARRLIDVADPLGESALESAVALALDDGGIERPVRQLEIWEDGSFLARVDFAWPALRVVLEADGRGFHDQPEALHRDRTRQNALAAAGWLPLRTTWAEAVGSPSTLVDTVGRAVDSRGWIDVPVTEPSTP